MTCILLFSVSCLCFLHCCVQGQSRTCCIILTRERIFRRAISQSIKKCFLFLFNYMCFCVGRCTWVQVPTVSRREHWIPWSWSYRYLCIIWCWGRKPNSSSVQEQYVLSTVEPSLQSQAFSYCSSFLLQGLNICNSFMKEFTTLLLAIISLEIYPCLWLAFSILGIQS